MIKSITFKCSDGTVFTLKLDNECGFVYLDCNGKREISVLTGCGFHFHNNNKGLFPGKYQVIARLIKKYGIYDRGVDSVVIERDYPYHADKFHFLTVKEKRIAMEKQMRTKCWFEYSKKMYAYKFAEK